MCRLGRDPHTGYDFLPIGENGERIVDISRHVDRLFPTEILEAGSGTVVTFHGKEGVEDTLLGQPSDLVEHRRSQMVVDVHYKVPLVAEVETETGEVLSVHLDDEAIGGPLEVTAEGGELPGAIRQRALVIAESSMWLRWEAGW